MMLKKEATYVITMHAYRVFTIQTTFTWFTLLYAGQNSSLKMSRLSSIIDGRGRTRISLRHPRDNAS